MGLTTAEVSERVAAGKVNKVDDSSSRSLGEIIRSNVFTRFNALITVLAVVVLVIGSPRDALFAAVMVFNAVIGIAQELRSKATLDRLSVVAAPRLTVIRNGERVVVGREEVVLDDVVRAGARRPARGGRVDPRGRSAVDRRVAADRRGRSDQEASR